MEEYTRAHIHIHTQGPWRDTQTVSHPFEEGHPEARGEATTYPKAEQQS